MATADTSDFNNFIELISDKILEIDRRKEEMVGKLGRTLDIIKALQG